MNWSNLEKMKLVFAIGSPKSGTTFLQMILNNHPEVSCAPEVAFSSFFKKLQQIFEELNQTFEDIDKKTARQGPVQIKEAEILDVYRFIVKKIAYLGAKGRTVKWYGLNENEILIYDKFKLYSELFPESKFIVIVRDPRSIAVSSWYHNLRTQKNFKDNVGSLENWCQVVGKIWKKEQTALLNFAKEPLSKDKLFICRYEDLVLFPLKWYTHIFEFLNVDTREDIIKQIIENTSFKKFQDGKFFRKASIDEWKEVLSSLAIKFIEKECAHIMQLFEYELLY